MTTKINYSIYVDTLAHDRFVNFSEVYDAVMMLEPHKNVGVSGVNYDFSINACDELYAHLAYIDFGLACSWFFTNLVVCSHHYYSYPKEPQCQCKQLS
jgi:hypothetical protein